MPKVEYSSKNAHWHRSDRLKTCIACNKDKELSDFSAYKYITNQGKESVRYESRCRECNRIRRMERYSDPILGGDDRASHREWLNRNSEHTKTYAAIRQQLPEIRALKAAHQRARKARIRSGSDNTDPRIGALYKQAKALETKLRACVDCDDDLELQVHVDHRIPLKLGGKHVFENLQILSGKENLMKGARLPRLAVTKENLECQK